MFNALNGLGAGGLGAENINTTNAANSVLYACFAVVGVFAGSITNTFGVRSALSVWRRSGFMYDRRNFTLSNLKKC